MNRAQAGMTLVELMVAMLIGLILIGATASVYIANKDTYRTSEVIARMQENGRVALHMIVDDLRMAGFMGNNTNPVLVANRLGSTTPLGDAGGDCASGWYIDTTSLLVVGNDQPPVVNGTSFGSTCLSGRGYQATTDVIALKHAAAGEIDEDDVDDAAHATWTLISSDLLRSAFFIGGTPAPPDLDPLNTTTRRWLAHVYFIAPDDDGVPLLRRLVLGSGPNFYSREVVRGVQDLQIQYGIDRDGDGTPDSFVEPGTEGAAKIVAARVWLLMRSETPDAGHDDSIHTYEYGTRRYIPGDAGSDNGSETEENPVRYRRMLLSTTVTLRNHWQ